MDYTSQVAAIGDDVTFKCTVRGIPPFTVTWMNSSREVLSETSIDSSDDVSTGVVFLSLMNITTEDYQTYTCSGINDDENETAFVSESVILSKLTLLSIARLAIVSYMCVCLCAFVCVCLFVCVCVCVCVCVHACVHAYVL